MSCLQPTPPGCTPRPGCVDNFNCPPRCPDFEIKRHDTRPAFRVEIQDENGPIDLTDLVLEANMWANAKFKKPVAAADTSFGLADNIGFYQILPNDIIVVDRVRSPEYMRVTGFDETNKLVKVQRGYKNTTPSDWPRGQRIRVFRAMNAPAATEMSYGDITNPDGTVTTNVLQQSFFIYEWTPNDTCVPGCFYMEFKLLKMGTPSPTPSVTPLCTAGFGVDWVRRFPVEGEGFLIRVVDSPTAEL